MRKASGRSPWEVTDRPEAACGVRLRARTRPCYPVYIRGNPLGRVKIRGFDGLGSDRLNQRADLTGNPRSKGIVEACMDQATWVLLAALVLSAGFGLWRSARDGRFRGTRAVRPARPAEADPVQQAAAGRQDHPLAGLGHDLGERATLLQFSSAFCAPCRVTRRVLAEV